jgi:hypothetical protein
MCNAHPRLIRPGATHQGIFIIMKTKNIVLSAALAAAALSIAVFAAGHQVSPAESANSPGAEPTPYSADHSRIEYHPGTLTEQPATF